MKREVPLSLSVQPAIFPYGIGREHVNCVQVVENVLAMTANEIFPVLISVSAAGSIQSETNSSDNFGMGTAQPNAPARASKYNVT
jgi:hypothetical protein